MQTVNERLAALPDILGYESPAALARACGLDPNTLRKAMQGPSKPSFDVLEAITKRHWKLSASWLLLGSGEPLIDREAKPAAPSTQSNVSAEPEKPETPEQLRAKMAVVPESAELQQVKGERDYLRKQLDSLLAVLHGKPYTPGELSTTAVAAGGKLETSSDAADLRETIDELAEEFPIAYHIVAKEAPGFKPKHLQLA